LATYHPVGGASRVVPVREPADWVACFCTDPNASVVEILEAFADRETIEQDFRYVKEVWGTRQRQGGKRAVQSRLLTSASGAA
jgi:hypothetical protein